MYKKRKPENALQNESEIKSIMDLPQTDNCVFALNLNKDLKEEHVIIGELKNVQRYLLGYDVELLENKKRPFGTLIDELSDTTNMDSFIHACYELNQYTPDYFYNGGFNKSLEFLKIAASSSNLAEQFVAIRILQEKNRELKNNVTHDINIYDVIAWPFLFESSAKEAIINWQQIRRKEGNLRNVFPHSINENLEFLLHTSSLYSAKGNYIIVYQVADTCILSLLLWYMHIVFSENEYFQECKNCGRMFHASHKGGELCSDECKKNQRRLNKAKFDEKAKETDYEPAYKRVYMYWYNRLSKIKKDSSIPAKRILFLDQKFKDFCDEAKLRKKRVRLGTAEFKDFNEWLFAQQAYADTLFKNWN